MQSRPAPRYAVSSRDSDTHTRPRSMADRPDATQPSGVISGIVKAEHMAGDLMQGAERIVNRVAPPSERDLIRRALDLSTRKKLLLARRLWKDPRVQSI